MNHIFNETAAGHYLAALQSWKLLDENATSHALNAARDAVLGGRHATEFSDEYARQIMPDLTAHEFFGLYGDPVKKGKRSYSDWVQDGALAAKAERHLRMLTHVGVEPALAVA
jgi:hypothetical protein